VDKVESARPAHRRDELRVVAPDGSLAGYNFDAFGYVASIREREPLARRPRTIVVIGAAAERAAVLVSLIDEGAREIRLINRTPARAQALAQELGGPIKAVAWNDREARSPAPRC